jgi:hypothetical protein
MQWCGPDDRPELGAGGWLPICFSSSQLQQGLSEYPSLVLRVCERTTSFSEVKRWPRKWERVRESEREWERVRESEWVSELPQAETLWCLQLFFVRPILTQSHGIACQKEWRHPNRIKAFISLYFHPVCACCLCVCLSYYPVWQTHRLPPSSLSSPWGSLPLSLQGLPHSECWCGPPPNHWWLDVGVPGSSAESFCLINSSSRRDVSLRARGSYWGTDVKNPSICHWCQFFN